MTEKEAAKVLLENVPKCCKMVDGRYQGGFDDWDCDMGQAIRVAVFAMQEIQQYREIGTVENLKLWCDLFGLDGFDELAAYKKIGTVEECREAMEKQKPKKPEDVEYDYSYFICPVCGDGIYVSDDYEIHKFCLNCGQAIDWSEEDEIPGRNVP